MENAIIEIGYNKHGEIDFGVRGDIVELSHEHMKDFRAMIVVAIGTAESMWRFAQEQNNLPQQAK